MSYVIVNNATGKLYKARGNFSHNMYETERGAKGVATRLNGTLPDAADAPYEAMSYTAYREKFPVKMVTRTNLMSGLQYEEAEDTPNFCSPASEAYWSM